MMHVCLHVKHDSTLVACIVMRQSLSMHCSRLHLFRYYMGWQWLALLTQLHSCVCMSSRLHAFMSACSSTNW